MKLKITARGDLFSLGELMEAFDNNAINIDVPYISEGVDLYEVSIAPYGAAEVSAELGAPIGNLEELKSKLDARYPRFSFEVVAND